VDSKTRRGEHSIALPPMLAEELGNTAAEIMSGGRRSERLAKPPASFRPGMRPMHDLGRVTSITNGVRANEHGLKLQARAGHASFATTQRHISTSRASLSMRRRRRSRNGCFDLRPNLLPD
jgi:hypothetical protein